MLDTEEKKLSISELQKRTKQLLMETYLPKEYPESVAKEFLPFTMYFFVSGVTVSAMVFVSTQSLFVALGGSSSQA